jgi:acetylornithine deacetylase/succinyl-diaminopimelate desuccinylase-like protein
VIPAVATALVNHRVHPGQSVAEVVEQDRRNIDDARVKLAVTSKMEAHRVSPFGPEDLAYQLIATSVRQSFEKVVVAPCEYPLFILVTRTFRKKGRGQILLTFNRLAGLFKTRFD